MDQLINLWVGVYSDPDGKLECAFFPNGTEAQLRQKICDSVAAWSDDDSTAGTIATIELVDRYLLKQLAVLFMLDEVAPYDGVRRDPDLPPWNRLLRDLVLQSANMGIKIGREHKGAP